MGMPWPNAEKPQVCPNNLAKSYVCALIGCGFGQAHGAGTFVSQHAS
jgi:hypothetical protein